MIESSGHPTNRKLKILQYNLAKGRETTDSVLNDDSIKQFTILLLQEQYWSNFLDSSLLHQSWTLLEPTIRTDQTPRSAIYINNNALPSAAFTQVRIPFHDVTAVAITPNNNDKPTLLINIYKPCDKNTIPPLRQYLARHLRPTEYANIIILGDFNLHHPLWNPQNYAKHDNEADELVEMMEELHLRLLIPPGTITRPTTNAIGGTTIDLVWGNENAEDTVLKCHTVSRTHDHGSDHYPIETVIDMEPKLVEEIQKPFNFAKTNWKSLETKLQGYLPALIDPEHTSPTDLDQFATQIVTALQQAISETTPRKKPCPHSKRWWNNELAEMRKSNNRLRNIYGRTRNERHGKEWRNKRDEYKHAIKRAKENLWKQFVDEANDRTIWNPLKKYIDAKPTPYYIPAINDAMSNDEKATEFATTFFPPPPPANLIDIESTTYPEPVQINTKITERQLERAIDKLSPNKAPGPDEITNGIIKKTFDKTHMHLLAMVQASINLGHFPACFKATTTIILRKPQKSDYTKPNAYRPIALENTLGKIIESVVTDLLSYLTETHNLLPANHFGGRPGRTGEDAMAILSEKIHMAWKERDTYSVIFMDVAGAFNNVHHQRLLHNLKKRRVPISIVRWVGNFLTGRTTQLRFNSAVSDTIATGAGIPQGSPISPLLYMFYNADLLDVPGRNELGLGFIDDIAYGVQGQTGEENVTKLQRMLGEAEKWREKHGARFETSKYVLVHFTKRRAAITTPIRIANSIIQPSQEAKYLGVIFDKQLRFKLHLQHATKKGSKFAHAMSRIAKSTWGTTYQQTRRLFNAVVAPRIDYAAIIWYRPVRYGYPQRPAQLSKLESAQRTAMKAVLSTFRTTPTTALEVESGLMPPHLRLQSKILRSYTRFTTLPPSNPVNACLKRASTSTSRIHISPLEYLTRTFSDYTPSSMETIHPYVRPPWWIPNTNIEISSNKKEAKQRHDEAVHDPNTICIYTDGSGIDGQIGAAAVCQTTSVTRKQYIGTESSHNVYAAELAAIKLAVDIVQAAPRTYDKCVIYTDSQPAIKATAKPGQQSGQSILTSVIDAFETLQYQQPDIEISLVWVPGHMNIAGNEEADKAAKEAARSRDGGTAHKTMKSARNQTIKRATKMEWKIGWEKEKTTAQHLRLITTKTETEAQNAHKLYNIIDKRPDIAMLSRLRTGHCFLNQYLHRFHHEDSPECTCGSGALETVEHFLIHCPKYDKERAKLIKNVGGAGGMWIERLLGHPKIIKFTLEYVKETGRFGNLN
jgi:ribonuclease HI